MEIEELVDNDGTSAVQEHPDEVADAQTAPAYGERNEKLPEQLKNALKQAVRECEQQEQYDRRREVLRDRRNRFYERGIQHIYENSRAGCFTVGTAGAVVSANGAEIQCPNYIDDYNIFAPCLEILESVLTQNPPGIDFRAQNPKLSEDMEAAETAEGYRQMFDRANAVKELQTQIVRTMALSGRTIVWTRTEANAQRFGRNPDGSAKHMEVATVYGTLESKVPITARSEDECPYVFLTDDPDLKSAKAEYPDFAKEIKPSTAGLGESAYERMARLGVLQGSRSQAQLGDAYTHLVTRLHAWLRPVAFTGEYYDDPLEAPEESDFDENGQVLTVAAKLKQLFPSGCHAVFIGDVYVASWDESLDDALAIGFPYPGDGMSRAAMMDRGIVVQDRFNDDRNAYAEVKDHGWPSTWVDADEAEYDSFASQKADPYAIRQKKYRAGVTTEQQFFREPDPAIPATFVADTEGLLTLLYFMLGTPPALFGQAETDQKTAAGFAQMRAQAMGRLGLAWSAIQKLMARMYYQAALAAAANPDHSEEIVVAGAGGPAMTLRLERLTKGKFGAYADEDSSFPESTSAKRAQLMQIVEMAAQSPVGMSLFESPDNWEQFKELLGFPELELVEATARNKQVREIEILLEQSPVPPAPEDVAAAQTAHAAAAVIASTEGSPPPAPPSLESLLKPSIPVDELDFHAYEGRKGQEWLSSEECWRQLALGNQAGVLNVKLHTKEHLKLAALAAMQQAAAAQPAPPQGRAGALPHAKPKGEPGSPNAISAPPGAPGAATM